MSVASAPSQTFHFHVSTYRLHKAEHMQQICKGVSVSMILISYSCFTGVFAVKYWLGFLTEEV